MHCHFGRRPNTRRRGRRREQAAPCHFHITNSEVVFSPWKLPSFLWDIPNRSLARVLLWGVFYKIWVIGKEKNPGRGTIWSKIVEKEWPSALSRTLMPLSMPTPPPSAPLVPCNFSLSSSREKTNRFGGTLFWAGWEMAVLFIPRPVFTSASLAGRLTACSAAPFFGRFQRAAFSMRKAACPWLR